VTDAAETHRVLTSSSANIEGELVGERRIATLPKWVSFLSTRLPWLILLWLTISFGGVHKLNYLATQIILFLSAAAVLWYAAGRSQSHDGPLPVSSLVVLSFGWLCIGIPFLAGIGASGPPGVAPSTYQRILSPATLSHLQFTFFLGLSFLLLRFGLLNRAKKGTGMLSSIAVLTACIALAHWLSDNGKLFWYFSPRNEFASPRVRWPFVNADHLAHFLIPGLFLLIGQLRMALGNLAHFTQHYQPTRKNKVGNLFSSQRFQSRLTHLLALSVGLLLIGIAIAGSLSRAAWAAISVGVVGLLLFERFILPPRNNDTQPSPNADQLSRYAPRSRERSIRGRPFDLWSTLRRWVRPFLFVIALLAFLFFLNERGRELFADRLEYGLLHTKDDIRWQMYRDTLPAISEHLWFGVGIGNWEPYFRHSMDPLLAGINPVYLHSDPLQLITEVGLVGFAPLLILFLMGSRAAIQKIRTSPHDRAVRLSSLLLAIWCVLGASCFDFPFRIPAIALQFTLLLAMLCAKCEDTPTTEAKVLPSTPLAQQVEVVES
jgi:O-antigen ligase